MTAPEIYIAIIPLFTAAFAAVLGLRVWTKRENRSAHPFLVVLLGCAYWSLLYSAELLVTDGDIKLFLAKIQYLGIVVVPPAWFLLVLNTAGYPRYMNRTTVSILSVVPAITFAGALTNDYHGLIWEDVTASASVRGMLVYHHGPLFWLYETYALLLIFWGGGLLIHASLDAPRLFARRHRLVLWSMVIPWLANVAYVFRLGPFPELDLAPEALLVSGILLWRAIAHYDLTVIVPFARQHILDHLLEGLIVVNAEGSITDTNPAARAILGAHPRELVGRNAAEVFESIPPLATLSTSPDGARTRWEIATPPKNEIYDASIHGLRDSHGNLLCRIIECRSVTREVEAQKMLRKLSLAVEQNPASIVITDANGVIEYINPRFTETTGYTFDELKGQTPRVLRSGETPAEQYEILWKTIVAGGVWDGEFHNKKKNGELFWERASISPLVDENGVVTHFVGVKEDITKQKYLESQLMHAQKLESVGRLAGGIAHDFNNMLQAIIGCADLALARVDPNSAIVQDLNEIRKAAHHSANLTRQLLAFARKQNITPMALDPNEVVGSVSTMLQRMMGENIVFVWKPTPNLWSIKVDSYQIVQVLANLAVNARDAMPRGGTLTIQASNVLADDAYCVRHLHLSPGKYVMLEITDTGAGMDEEVIAHIFEPFFTTKETGKGTGLGLAMAYGIVKQHDGFIFAESKPGGGSTFRIFLPRTLERREQIGQTRDDDDYCTGTETVLVVDDEWSVLEVTSRALESRGYTVLKAESATEAISIWERHSGKIDLLIADVVMPETSGSVLKAWVGERRKNLKYLFVSGCNTDSLASRGVACEGLHFLQKPFDVDVLAKRVREILDS